MIYGYFTLLVALVISGVAEYYSIIGLTAIFSASFWPIVIMGASLGVGKITAAVWLKLNWKRTPWTYKIYLVPAVSFLMMLTSIGCFGYLSKAHSDQSLVSGDAAAKVALYDEKIKTAKDNINANRTALKQMDEAVDQVMGRSTDEKGADKAVQIRRSQQKERARLLSDIEVEQKKISQLMEDRAPLAAENRKIESEVGPIKYIAALIYGDSASDTVLEKAVRLVIVMIVLVFDPLALCLILAANKQFEWAREDRQKLAAEATSAVLPVSEPPDAKIDKNTSPAEHRVCLQCGLQIAASANPGPYCPNPQCGNSTVTAGAELSELAKTSQLSPEELDALSNITVPESDNNVLAVDTGVSDDQLDPCYKCGTPLLNAPGIGPFCPNKECDVVDGPFLADAHTVLEQNNWDFDQPDEEFVQDDLLTDWTDHDVDHQLEEIFANTQELVDDPDMADDTDLIKTDDDADIEIINLTDDEMIKNAMRAWKAANPEDTLKHQRQLLAQGRIDRLPWMPMSELQLEADNKEPQLGVMRGFGAQFPVDAVKGDSFMRVDQLPGRLYKHNGVRWIEVDRDLSDQYVYDTAYIDHLIAKIGSGEYDIELLTDLEREQIGRRLLNE
jgi:hypothetical protein